MFLTDFIPKSILCFRTYTLRTFLADVIAGVTVGLVALPLAMAFAISSGLSPQTGIYTAVVAGFIISAFGGSRVQIGGPTGAFVVVVSSIATKYGFQGLLICTIMAGVILVVLGLTGLGDTIKFIPRPIIIGFTNGIALLIASTQIRDFFGLRMDSVPSDFLPRMDALAAHFSSLSVTATSVALVALLVLVAIRVLRPQIPGSIVVLFVATAVVAFLKLPVETIGTRFGSIPAGQPPFIVPSIHWANLGGLLTPALTIAMLGAIESLMSASVADRMIGDTHNPNVELVAQGLANIVAPFFGGIPATGAIARTATNIKSGAQTPVAGMIHAVTLALILLIAAPLASYIPLSVLAAILLMVAWNMGEWLEIPKLLKLPKADVAIWAITFLLTVFADLSIAVEVGMIIAALTFIHKVTATTTVTEVTPEDVDEGRVHVLQDKVVPPYVAVFRIHGPFLFGSTDKIRGIIARLEELPEIVALRLRNMTAIDGTGLLALEDLARDLRGAGKVMIVCGAREQPLAMMENSEFEEIIGRENICENFQHALRRAEELHTAHAAPHR
ncbi:MAG TPA: sulfate permease [Bryobacteraceae bacterium]|jgi:SulP family sulfate permease|nr:sulfate permease [Bryobacteraceae bacterium]